MSVESGGIRGVVTRRNIEIDAADLVDHCRDHIHPVPAPRLRILASGGNKRACKNTAGLFFGRNTMFGPPAVEGGASRRH